MPAEITYDGSALEAPLVVPLRPTPAERRALDATIAAFGAACAVVIATGRAAETTSNAVLHRLCYRRLRSTYGLNANLAIRGIARAARRLKQPRPVRDEAVIDYDARTLRFRSDGAAVSLASQHGRLGAIRVDLDFRGRLRLGTGRLVRATLRRLPGRHYELIVWLAAPHEHPSGTAS